MDFYAVLDHVLDLLRHRRKVTYKALQLQFHLDEVGLTTLKEELLYAHPQVVDDDGCGLVWTGETPPPEMDVRHGITLGLSDIVTLVTARLQQEKRLTYAALKHVFGLDDATLDVVRQELIFAKRVAADEHGRVLVWAREAPFTDLSALTTTAHDMPPIAPDVMPTRSIAEDVPVASDRVTDTPSAPRSPTPEAERRQVTVLFCDLVGSTTLSQQLDAEEYRAVVRAYQEAAVAALQPWDGYVAQYLGDGLMVYFGWPRAHEDSAVRAVHASLALLEGLEPLNTHLEAHHSVRVQVRLGLHTGLAVIGEMGGGDRHEQLAMGDTPNIAARIQGVAGPDTLAISVTTARLVQHAFVLDDLGMQTLKGVAEPLRVYGVRGSLTSPDDDDISTPRGVPFLVGRDEEVGLLLRRWEQSKAGLGQVALLSGEAGIGKSSLVETLRVQVRQEGLPRIAYRCSPYHTNSALYPVIEQVRRVCQIQLDDPPATKLDKLEQTLHAYSFPLADVVPLLAALLSVPLAAHYAALTLSPQQVKQHTQDTLIAWLLAEAERQPVLAVWEDLHWADPSTLELLGLLIEQAPTAAMLHLLTFRPEFTSPWPARSHMTPIALNRLERPQVEAMITHVASGKTLPAEVVEHIVAKTDGVPLYVEELTKMFLESSLLHAEAESYTLRGPLAAVPIPATLQDSLMARLDQLNRAKDIAQLGAVLGREFTYDMVQALAVVDESTVQDGLAQLVTAELLYQRGRPPRARYFFKHALIQDTAYASLLRSTRQQLHQQVAQLFEARFPETVETQPELLAHHYTEASLHEQAVDYWHKAGQKALERSAYIEAIQHLRKGLALLSDLPETPPRLQQEFALQSALGPALTAIKGFSDPEVEYAYTRAQVIGRQIGDQRQLFMVLRGLCHLRNVRGECPAAYALAEELLTIAQQEQEPSLLAAAHYDVGTIAYRLGAFMAARTRLEAGLTYYHAAQYKFSATHVGFDPCVGCHVRASEALWMLGFPLQAVERMHEAVRLARALSHPFTLAFALSNLCHLHVFVRQVQAAQECAESLIAFSEEQGFQQWRAMATAMRGWTLALQGHHVEGMAQMHQGIHTLRAIAAQLSMPYLLALLAEAHVQAGHLAAGFEALDEALTQVQKNGERFYEAEIHRLKGQLLLQQAIPDAPQAAACFHTALDVARSQQASSLELRAAMSLARLWQQQGKRQEAYELLAPVYNWFTEGFDTTDLQTAKALLETLA